MTIENTIYGELPNTDIALGFDRNGKFSGGSFIAIIDPYARNNIAELVKQLSKYGQGNRTTKPLKSKNRLNCEQKGEPSCSPIRLTI